MYAKIFSSMFDGSMRGKSNLILVFVNMLTRCDKEGFDDRHPKSISDETGLPLDSVIDALKALEAEDQESRTPDRGGKRIELLDPDNRSWGWSIVNYEKYRKMQDAESRRKIWRESKRKQRQSTNVQDNLGQSTSVQDNLGQSTMSTSCLKMSTEAEAEAEVEAKAEEKVDIEDISIVQFSPKLSSIAKKQPSKQNDHSIQFDEFWKAYPRKEAKKTALRSFERCMKAGLKLEDMLIGIENHKKTEQWQNPKYIPLPATWINNERWKDEVMVSDPSKQKTGPNGKRTPEQLEKIKEIEDRWIYEEEICK